MNINTENIDNYLFDYFEGEMNPQEADALMDFIHQNPTYEKDFMQWKKSYHHVDDKIASYGISSQLKSIAKTPYYTTTWFKTTIPSIICLCGIIWWHTSKPEEEKQTYTQHKTERTTAPRSISEPKPTKKTILKPLKKGKENKETTPLIKPVISLVDTSEVLQILVSAVEEIDTLTIETIALIEDTAEVSIQIIEPDTIIEKEKIIERPQDVKKKKHSSKRTNKTIPINPNF